MLFHPATKQFVTQLLVALQHYGPLHGPVRGRDGLFRLGPLSVPLSPSKRAQLTRLSLKKYLLPPQEELWPHAKDVVAGSATEAGVVLLGIAPCDLYALDYLDRVWADDVRYRAHRQRLFVVGMDCQPTDSCFCPVHEALPGFDLFWTRTDIWSGSLRGDAVLRRMTQNINDAPFASSGGWQSGRANTVQAAGGTDGMTGIDPALAQAAQQCLGCGACSAVCPTCYCFDRHDSFERFTTPRCERVWDNCLFSEHGLVAGGHNFRADRVSRFRFRLEHKRIGFGALRGTPSCVGCGRCATICPANIDLRTLLVTGGTM